MHSTHDTGSAFADVAAEEALVASLLSDPAVLDGPAGDLRPTDYMDALCREAHAAAVALRDEGEVATIVSVAERVSRVTGEPEGSVAVDLLRVCQRVHLPGEAGRYAGRIREAARRRRVHDHAVRLMTAAGDPTADVGEAVAAVIDLADDAGRPTRGPACRSAADLLAGYDPLGETEPRRYYVGEGAFLSVDLRPGRVLALAAPPGAGKTALVMQWVFDALRFDSSLRATVLNVEVEPRVLLDRELSRMSGVDLATVMDRRLMAHHRERIEYGLARIGEVADRLWFAGPPYTVETLEAAVRRHRPDIVVVDYLQRVRPRGEHATRIDALDSTVASCRDIAMEGRAVVAVSAVSRQRDARGNAGYGGLGLASLRGTSELEYGADDVYVLEADPDRPSEVTARHVKSRHGRRTDLRLTFDGAHQSFTATDDWISSTPVFDGDEVAA